MTAPVEWRLVPAEPTYEMLDNGRYFWGPWIDAEKTQRAGRRSEDPADVERARAVWEQMLAASPAPDEALREKVARAVLNAVFAGFEHGQCEAEWEPDYGLEIANEATDAILTAIFGGPDRG